MIFKLHEKRPLSALKLAKSTHKPVLPDGVFNVIQGDGRSRSNDHGSPRQSTKSLSLVKVGTKGKKGHGLASAAVSKKMWPWNWDGKCPMIIFPEHARWPSSLQLMLANFYTQGEVCTKTAQRVFVSRRQSWTLSPKELKNSHWSHDQLATQWTWNTSRRFDFRKTPCTRNSVTFRRQKDAGATLLCALPSHWKWLDKGAVLLRQTVFTDCTDDMPQSTRRDLRSCNVGS